MKQLKFKRTQCGLSLLLTMVMLAIIGILAEVALSACHDHVARAQVTEAVTSKNIEILLFQLIKTVNQGSTPLRLLK